MKIKAQNILIDILLITTQSPHTSQSLRFVKWVERKTNIYLSSHTHKHTHAQILKCITITFSNYIFMVKSFLQKKRYKIQFSPDFLLKHQLQRWATQNPNKNKPLWRSHFLLCISKLKWAHVTGSHCFFPLYKFIFSSQIRSYENSQCSLKTFRLICFHARFHLSMLFTFDSVLIYKKWCTWRCLFMRLWSHI